jgi:tetratricopeptide (TPR) repeat protein
MNSKEKEQSLKLAEHYFRNNSYSFAKQILEKVIKTDLNNSKANELLAYIHGNSGEIDTSFELLNVACNQHDCSPEALYYLGSMQLKKSLFTEATETFKKSILKGGEFFEALHDLATAQASLGDFVSSIDNYQKCLNFDETSFELFFNIARIFDELKRYDEALTQYDKALSLKPDYAEAWLNKGVTLNDLKRYDEAIAHYDKALGLKPDYAEAWSNKGVTLNDLKRYDEAIAHYDKALGLKPDYAEVWFNKGVTLNDLKRYDEAIAHYDKALGLKPDYAEAWLNKGVTLNDLKRCDEAIAHYDKALGLKPDYAEASWNKSLSLLLRGDFENGLSLYESRWTSEKVSKTIGKSLFDKPLWHGKESLQHKKILLYGEQGLGDFIQFCRYVKLVADLGAKVILEVPQPLTGLMQGLDGISQLVIKGEELPFFDYQCPLLSLPLAFKTNLDTIPNKSGYINLYNHTNKIIEWNARLGPKLKPRVGLVWSGNPHHKNDHNRSLLLRDILPFLPNQFEYISLQKEIREIDKLTLDSNSHILNFAGHLNDFLDTSALIDNLDLVISVDTSVAHLSGAFGKKTLLLLPYVPDWRWLLDRDDSPWYPSIKLYRQTFIGDWNSVLERVKLDLGSSYTYQ